VRWYFSTLSQANAFVSGFDLYLSSVDSLAGEERHLASVFSPFGVFLYLALDTLCAISLHSFEQHFELWCCGIKSHLQ